MRSVTSRQLGLLSGMSLLLGCATVADTQRLPLMVGGLVFENRSQTPLTTIQLLVPATGAFVSCGHISAGNRCATTFPEVVWQGNALEVTWTQAGNNWSTGQITLSPDPDVLSAGSALVRVSVIAPGSAGVLLEPMESP